MSSNKRLKELLKTYTEIYQRTCEESRQLRELAMLIPGKAQTIPKEGIIYGADNREKFSRDCKRIRDEAMSILDAEADRLEKKLKEPPSAEAVNSIRLLSMHGKSITQGDIDRLIDAYGDNYQAFKTIKSIADEKGIRVKAKDRTEEKLRAIEGLKRTIAVEVGLAGAERGRATTGFCSFLESEIDLIISE